MEIKHDGYRLIVHRVRLITRNDHDWSERYPLITEAALGRDRNPDADADLKLAVAVLADLRKLTGRRRRAYTNKSECIIGGDTPSSGVIAPNRPCVSPWIPSVK